LSTWRRNCRLYYIYQLRLWCILWRETINKKQLAGLLKKKITFLLLKKFYKNILRTTFVAGRFGRRCRESVFSNKPGRRICKLGSRFFRICLANTCRHRERKRNSGKRRRQLGMQPGTSTNTGKPSKPSKRTGKPEKSRPEL